MRESSDIIRRLRKEGWKLRSIRGSHHNFRHPDFKYLITVPHPKQDLAIGTARNIARLAGWRDKTGKES
jgi:predicted RNA binding protein YcfA (HicA-like mRNA interferase family)